MSAPATGQDITVWQGDTHVLAFRVDDGSDTDPQPVDLTGATAKWWAAKNATSTGDDIFIEKSTDTATVSLSYDAGTQYWSVIVPINPADTQHIPKGNWYHECEVVLASGAVGRVALGKFKVNPSLIPAT